MAVATDAGRFLLRWVVTLGITVLGVSVLLALVWSQLAVDSFSFALTLVPPQLLQIKVQ